MTLSNVDTMIPGLRYNAAVAQIYSLVNAIEQAFRAHNVSKHTLLEAISINIQMIAPMMPHLAEECWQRLGKTGMISAASWPVANPALLVEDEVTLPIQINGKKRGEITLPRDATKQLAEESALAQDFV